LKYLYDLINNDIHNDTNRDTIRFILEILGNCFYDNKSYLLIKVKNFNDVRLYRKKIEKLSNFLGIKIKSVDIYTIKVEYINDNDEIIHNIIKFIDDKDTKYNKNNYLFDIKDIQRRDDERYL